MVPKVSMGGQVGERGASRDTANIKVIAVTAKRGIGNRCADMGTAFCRAGQKRIDLASAGRSSGFRLVTVPESPSHAQPWLSTVAFVNSGAWPITAAAPQRICTVFPFHSAGAVANGKPDKTGGVIDISPSVTPVDDIQPVVLAPANLSRVLWGSLFMVRLIQAEFRHHTIEGA